MGDVVDFFNRKTSRQNTTTDESDILVYTKDESVDLGPELKELFGRLKTKDERDGFLSSLEEEILFTEQKNLAEAALTIVAVAGSDENASDAIRQFNLYGILITIAECCPDLCEKAIETAKQLPEPIDSAEEIVFTQSTALLVKQQFLSFCMIAGVFSKDVISLVSQRLPKTTSDDDTLDDARVTREANLFWISQQKPDLVALKNIQKYKESFFEAINRGLVDYPRLSIIGGTSFQKTGQSLQNN